MTQKIKRNIHTNAKRCRKRINKKRIGKKQIIKKPINKKRVSKKRKVIIYGKHHNKVLPIKTDRKGRLLTISESSKPASCRFRFKERKIYVETTDVFWPCPLENISHAVQYVYCVSNLGNADAEVNIEVGTSKKHMAHDIGPEQIPAFQTKIVTPLRFSKYIRLSYRSTQPGTKTKLLITFQAQIHK